MRVTIFSILKIFVWAMLVRERERDAGLRTVIFHFLFSHYSSWLICNFNMLEYVPDMVSFCCIYSVYHPRQFTRIFSTKYSNDPNLLFNFWMHFTVSRLSVLLLLPVNAERFFTSVGLNSNVADEASWSFLLQALLGLWYSVQLHPYMQSWSDLQLQSCTLSF